ncbi:MAG: signal peptidase II [Chromatiales bacterium]|jgi:signal peptidase II|nr:signal peptidase II [Chromatiales bacterium]MDH3931987.1 signal peptidase II [Chromatiales bacterium]PLX56369.1 MAG: signal peptidase II [Chromatiales bacterium]
MNDRIRTHGASQWLWLSLIVIVADQASKWWIRTRFDLYDRIEIVPWLDITRLHNTGAAFSFLSDAGGWQRWMFIGLALAVTLFIMIWLRRLPRTGQTLLAIALSLIVGGALGNVIDRAMLGHVVDFISVHRGTWYFPAFNVADSAISVGAALLILEALLDGRRKEPESESA